MNVSIEFEVPGVSKKVFRRYCRYAGWFHKPGPTIGYLALFLLWIGMGVLFAVIAKSY
jgi:hypothetical protein